MYWYTRPGTRVKWYTQDIQTIIYKLCQCWMYNMSLCACTLKRYVTCVNTVMKTYGTTEAYQSYIVITDYGSTYIVLICMHNMQDKLQDIITGQPSMETIVTQLMMNRIQFAWTAGIYSTIHSVLLASGRRSHDTIPRTLWSMDIDVGMYVCRYHLFGEVARSKFMSMWRIPYRMVETNV